MTGVQTCALPIYLTVLDLPLWPHALIPSFAHSHPHSCPHLFPCAADVADCSCCSSCHHFHCHPATWLCIFGFHWCSLIPIQLWFAPAWSCLCSSVLVYASRCVCMRYRVSDTEWSDSPLYHKLSTFIRVFDTQNYNLPCFDVGWGWVGEDRVCWW